MDIEEFSSLIDSMALPAVSEEEFHEAAEAAKHMTNLGNEERLQFYALFKQSTVGNINTSRPWSINMVEAAKWSVIFLIY
jgi:acyl-CoA-binding protein